ncbi:LysE family translocator [Paenibacillus sp. HW567]|uniref:LysE family translocator n=1 Tax=Paenibacillus sp. HW567 TaxID=1034769 RepID=UPI00037B99EF|nr:LysE family transporter [Paenibacillus sp. HW567]
MIIWSALLSGCGFGFAIAAPVGPMSLLCMNRTLRQGFLAGLATGLGITLADMLYALVTVSSIKVVNNFTTMYALPLRLLGSLFLGYLGVRALLPASTSLKTETMRGGMSYSLASSFLLTLANPATLLSFMALAASLGTSIGCSWFLPVGIALGSGCWWLLLSTIIYWIRGRLPASFIRSLNLCSSVILILFSLYGILTALTGHGE